MKLKIALLLAALAARAFAGAPAPINLAITGTAEELTALERIKVDYVFGTPEQKLAVLAMYADDFQGIGYGPTGPARSDHVAVVQKLTNSTFPAFPAGTFKMSDVHVVPVLPGCIVISYTASGPGPDGKPWSAFLSSTWARRGAEWKTIYYQATTLPTL